MILFGSWTGLFDKQPGPRKWSVKLRVAERRLKRNCKKLERQESKILKEVKKAAERGDLESAKLYAKDVFRTRKLAHGSLRLSLRIKNIRRQLEHATVIQEVVSTMDDAVESLKKLSRGLDIDELDKILGEFEMQMAEVDIKAESMDETVDMVSYSENEEQAVEDIVKQFLMEEVEEKLEGLVTTGAEANAVKATRKTKKLEKDSNT
ncbi:MAG: Snf7 family protein [Candidatus Odinarchaeota archaeon]